MLCLSRVKLLLGELSRMKIFKSILGWIAPIIIGIVIALLIKQYLLTLVQVSGISMQPNLQNKERIMVLRQAKISHNSVIVFNAKNEDPAAGGVNKDYVKRVIGLPGDTVTYSPAGQLSINNKPMKQTYISRNEQKNGTLSQEGVYFPGFTLASLQTVHTWTYGTHGTNVIPKNYYFVMGDHRSKSNDGRYWGLVPKSQILGVVKVWPWNSHVAEINSYH